MKISFSGHETFVCRQFWLKKGYEHILANRSFSDEDAVVHLGVGKNMTTAIKFWLRGFNIIDDADQITEFGQNLLERYDPYWGFQRLYTTDSGPKCAPGFCSLSPGI